MACAAISAADRSTANVLNTWPKSCNLLERLLTDKGNSRELFTFGVVIRSKNTGIDTDDEQDKVIESL